MHNLLIQEIYTIKKHLHTFFNEEFKELNLKSSEIKFIHILSLSDGESQVELSKRLDCDKSHIHRLVIKLLMKKIIFLSKNKEENCRNVQIKLTENGKEIAEIINKKIKEWQLKTIKGIDDDDLKATQRVFNQLINNLKKEK